MLLITQQHYTVPFTTAYPAFDTVTMSGNETIESIFNLETIAPAYFTTATDTTDIELTAIYDEAHTADTVMLRGFASAEDLYLLMDEVTISGADLTLVDDIYYDVDITASGNELSEWYVTVPANVANLTSFYEWEDLILGNRFEVPQYNQARQYKYYYSMFPYNEKFPRYNTALSDSNKLIKECVFTWSGLTDAEHDVFVDFIESFGNSYKPFYIYNSVEETVLKYLIIGDSVNMSKDLYDLWEVVITAYEIDPTD